MGCECSKMKVCSVCHEPCSSHVYVLKNGTVKVIYCLQCVRYVEDTKTYGSYKD